LIAMKITIAKMLIYKVCSALICLGLVYLFTRRLALASWIGLADFGATCVFYVIFEKVWKRIENTLSWFIYTHACKKYEKELRECGELATFPERMRK